LFWTSPTIGLRASKAYFFIYHNIHCALAPFSLYLKQYEKVFSLS